MSAIVCPKCGCEDSVAIYQGGNFMRSRECVACDHEFKTEEINREELVALRERIAALAHQQWLFDQTEPPIAYRVPHLGKVNGKSKWFNKER